MNGKKERNWNTKRAVYTGRRGCGRLSRKAPARHDPVVPLSALSPSDGFLFGEVMQDEQTCRTVLGIIPGRPVGRVVYLNKEQQMEAKTAYHKYTGIHATAWRCRRGTAITCRSAAATTRG